VIRLGWHGYLNPGCGCSCTSTVKLEHNCEPVRKKIKIEQDVATTAAAAVMYGSSVKSIYVLKNEDREIIETGRELTDKQIQYSQYLIKKQFSKIGGLHSTLLESCQRANYREFITGGSL